MGHQRVCAGSAAGAVLVWGGAGEQPDRRGVGGSDEPGVVRGNPDRVQSEVRSDIVAQSAEALIHDGDGNLVRDGRWMYSWDAENRLVRVMSYGASDRAGWRRVDWAYDALGRRIRQTSYVLSNGVWVVTEDLKFVSDPVWFGRHIVELNATNNALVRTYVWGLDLSGTMDGAGGVDGLLWVNQHTGSSAGAHFCAYDGNGNVVALVSANTCTETARYEYGPFGEPIRITGPMSKENPFRFSTKRTCNTTLLVLYEYRAYSPSLGRWLSRDPIEEVDFALVYSGKQPNREADSEDELTAPQILPRIREANPYGFVRNSPPDNVDFLGLVKFDQCLDDQIAQLKQAWNEMCALPKDSKFRCCVGRSRLLQMFERRCSWGNVKFKCRRNDQGLCPWACAHAWQSLGIGSGVIVVCDRQFYNPIECPLPLKCVLAHEMTHILGGTPYERGVVDKVTDCCLNN